LKEISKCYEDIKLTTKFSIEYYKNYRIYKFIFPTCSVSAFFLFEIKQKVIFLQTCSIVADVNRRAVYKGVALFLTCKPYKTCGLYTNCCFVYKRAALYLKC